MNNHKHNDGDRDPDEVISPIATTPSDPYAVNSLDRLFYLFGGGEWAAEVLRAHKTLQVAMVEHRDEFGEKGARGTLTIKLNYKLGIQGDVMMMGECSTTPPKKPAQAALAYVDDDGNMSMESPLMRGMKRPIRETPHDPKTGEILNA